MVGFSEYFESVIHQKPEWRKAFIDYDKIHRILLRLGMMTHQVNVDQMKHEASEQQQEQQIRQQQQQQQENNQNTSGYTAVGGENNLSSTTPTFALNNNSSFVPKSYSTGNLRRSMTPSLAVGGGKGGHNLLFPSNMVLRSRTNTPAAALGNANFSPGSNDGANGAGIEFPSDVPTASSTNNLNNNSIVVARKASNQLQERTPPSDLRKTPGSRTSTAPPPQNRLNNNNSNNNTLMGESNLINKPDDVFPKIGGGSKVGLRTSASADSVYHEHHHTHDYRSDKKHDPHSPWIADEKPKPSSSTRNSVKFRQDGVTYFDEHGNEVNNNHGDDDDDPEQHLLGAAAATYTPGSLNNTRRSRGRSITGGAVVSRNNQQPLTTTPFRTLDGDVLNDTMVVEELFNTSGAEKAQRIKQEGFDKLKESSTFQPATEEEIAKELFRLFKLREKALEDEALQQQVRDNTLLNQQQSSQYFANANSNNNNKQHPPGFVDHLTAGMIRRETSDNNQDDNDGNSSHGTPSMGRTNPPTPSKVSQLSFSGASQQPQPNVSSNTLPSSHSLHQKSRAKLNDIAGASMFRSSTGGNNNETETSPMLSDSNNNNKEGSSAATPLTSTAEARDKVGGGLFPVMKRDTHHQTLLQQRDGGKKKKQQQQSQQQQPTQINSSSSNNNLTTPPLNSVSSATFQSSNFNNDGDDNSSSSPSQHRTPMTGATAASTATNTIKAVPVPSKFHRKSANISPYQSPASSNPPPSSLLFSSAVAYQHQNQNQNQNTAKIVDQSSTAAAIQQYGSTSSGTGTTAVKKQTSNLSPSIQPLTLPPGITTKQTADGINPVQEYSPNMNNNNRSTRNNNQHQNDSNNLDPSSSAYGATTTTSTGQQQNTSTTKREKQTLLERRKGSSLANIVTSSQQQQKEGSPDRSPNSTSTNVSMKSKTGFPTSGYGFPAVYNVSTPNEPGSDNSLFAQQQKQPSHHSKFVKDVSSGAASASSRTSPIDSNTGSAKFPPPPPQNHQNQNNTTTKNWLKDEANHRGMAMERSNSNSSASLRQQQFRSGVSASHQHNPNNLSRRPSNVSMEGNVTAELSGSQNEHNQNNTGTGSENNNNNNQNRNNDTQEQERDTFPVDQVTYFDVFNMCIDLIQQNAAKASHFAEVSQQQLVRYFEEHQEAWKEQSEDHDPNRCKTHLRYLHHELTSLSAFVEANKLCVIKLVREFQAATDHLMLDDEEEELLAEEPDEVLETLRLEKCEDVILSSVREVEAFFALKFTGGNIGASKKLIQSKATSSRQAFRAGFFVAFCLATVLYWCHVFFELGVTNETNQRFQDALPVLRFCHVLSIAFLCWSGTLWVYETYSINYLYVLELDNIWSVTWQQMMEYALFLAWIVLFLGVMFVRSTSQQEYYSSSGGFQAWTPVFIPLMFFLFILLIVVPLRAVMRARTRPSFFKMLWACMKLPFGYVTFSHFFVADWGTSLPTTIGDLMYSLCYLGTYFSHLSKVHDSSLPSMDQCVHIHGHWGHLVGMIPYYWRGCQTMKMFLRTENRVHLLNHGKYISCLIAMTLELLNAFWPENEHLAIAMWFWHIFSQLYCWVWDVLFDWGHIGYFRGKSRKWLLPEECHWSYYFAIVADFCARMWFVPGVGTKVENAVDKNWYKLMRGDVEVARRAMWSVFRIENENTNNLETYRSIDFVPKVSLPPQDVMF